MIVVRKNGHNKQLHPTIYALSFVWCSLRSHFVTQTPAHKLRVSWALDSEIEKQLHLGLWFRSSVAGAIHVFCEDSYL